MYNISKYKTFFAIKECNDADIPATTNVISALTGHPLHNQRIYCTKYHKGNYIARKMNQERGSFHGFKYFLTAKGESVLEKYSNRYINGYDLNIKQLPKKIDWSGIELLPGIYILEELKKKV